MIELLIAAGIMVIAVAVAGSLLVAVFSMARNAESLSDDMDDARIAGETIAKAVQLSGLYVPGGIYINGGATAPTLSFPVFGMDGTSGQGGGGGTTVANIYPDSCDDIWVIWPDPNAMREACQDPGAGVVVTTAATSGKLSTECPLTTGALGAPLFNPANTDFAVVANMNTGALISKVTASLPSGNMILDYSESGTANFNDAPTGPGYQVGDVVYRARVTHYFVKNNPKTNHPALMSHEGLVGTDATTKRPLTDDPAWPDIIVQDGIEDLQIAYGFDTTNSGDPTQYTFQNFLAPEFNAATPLRTIRINVVAVSASKDTNAKGDATLVQETPIQVENHTTFTGLPTGYRRVLYTRRVELPNSAPGNL